MIAVDTNVLVYAHRAHLPHHATALQWLTHLAEGPTPWGLPVFCLGEFLRVVTHPRVFDPPSTWDAALDALSSIMRSPSQRVLNPGPRYAELLAEAVRTADARGNLVFDAQIVAVCREQGADRILTYDRDFTRFTGIDLVSPSTPPQDL